MPRARTQTFSCTDEEVEVLRECVSTQDGGLNANSPPPDWNDVSTFMQIKAIYKGFNTYSRDFSAYTALWCCVCWVRIKKDGEMARIRNMTEI
jgi:hypothetical protein